MKVVPLAIVLAGLGACACDGKKQERSQSTVQAPIDELAEKLEASPAARRTEDLSEPVPALNEPTVKDSINGSFLGGAGQSRVLFLDNSHIVHAWLADGKEHRDPVTTRPPPGERECKALRSLESQDFLLCLYWYTGPGGGRVDGLLFDLKRRISGEFFSVAVNTQLFGTLCYPDTMTGPMPAFWVEDWESIAATPASPARIAIKLKREGWTSTEAASLREVPATKAACECAGEENCVGELTPPSEKKQLVFELRSGRLHPSEDSVLVLTAIAAQWGHSSSLKAWNLKMRGYGDN